MYINIYINIVYHTSCWGSGFFVCIKTWTSNRLPFFHPIIDIKHRCKHRYKHRSYPQ